MSVHASTMGCGQGHGLALSGEQGRTYLGVRVEHDVQVFAVAQAQLLAEDDELAAREGAQEGRTRTGAQHDGAVVHEVRSDLGDLVVRVQLAVFAFLDLERHSIESARGAAVQHQLLVVEHLLFRNSRNEAARPSRSQLDAQCKELFESSLGREISIVILTPDCVFDGTADLDRLSDRKESLARIQVILLESICCSLNGFILWFEFRNLCE